MNIEAVEHIGLVSFSNVFFLGRKQRGDPCGIVGIDSVAKFGNFPPGGRRVCCYMLPRAG